MPEAGTETFFLWGPRQTGKTTLLRRTYPDAWRVDLLQADRFRRYATRPERLREELESDPSAAGRQIVIDEVQKVPALLDEVHWLMENRGLSFALCGSSARRVRRGRGEPPRGEGDALRTSRADGVRGRAGLRSRPDAASRLSPADLPAARPGRMLDAYIATYLKEEIVAEGLARRLPAFSDFLEAAALSDAELVNFAAIARECGVSGPTIGAISGSSKTRCSGPGSPLSGNAPSGGWCTRPGSISPMWGW